MNHQGILQAALALGLAALVGCGGSGDDEATWSFISPLIVQPNCATSSCHSSGAAVAGLDLSTARAGWDSLLRQQLPVVAGGPVARGNAARALVVPHNPQQSRLLHMLRGQGASRMPPDRPMPGADVALIERWILAGAKDD